MNSALKSSEKETKNSVYCLNCGSKLRGNYCHNCGQQANISNLTVRGFVMEYLYNAFMWDPKFLKTVWLLSRKPGALTNEFMSGKYVSQVHPRKLNMFMLFVFITMFMFFSGTETVNSQVEEITNDEIVSSALNVGVIIDNEEYLNKIQSSPRDTVKLHAPLLLAERYPDIITNVRTIEDTNGESLDRWVAVIPTLLIEDGIATPDADGYYCFKTKPEEVELVEAIWAHMVKVTTRFFPLLVLFTAPFLSFSLRLLQRKEKRSSLSRFIFSLHYTAFLELSIIFIYLLYLTVGASIPALQLMLLTCSGVYLTMAFRRVYGAGSWLKAGIKALCMSIAYLMIILFVFICIFFVGVIAVMPDL